MKGSNMPTLALLHTGHLLIPVFQDLGRELLPGVSLVHMLDESLLKNTIAAGRMEKATIRRIVAHIGSARDAGADAVLVTCSSIGPAIDVARLLFDFPVLRVDEAMAEEACRLGSRIGVMATIRTTLEPTMELLRHTAAAMHKECQIVSGLCDGAFEALVAGDTAAHDRLLSAKMAELAGTADLIVLAQASMAGALKRISGADWKVPVLSSPSLALRQAGITLAGLS
jgi:Asp/Glu/hydantoin racemase